MTAFSEVMASTGPRSLAGLGYRAALRRLRDPRVLTEAHSAPIWVPASSWAVNWALQDDEFEARVLRALAIQPAYLAGHVPMVDAEHKALGGVQVRLRYLEGRDLPAASIISASPGDPGYDVDEVASDIAQRCLAELEDLIGPATTPARCYVLDAWSDWLRAAPQWPCPLAEIINVYRLKAARRTWDSVVRPARFYHQSEAARRLALGTKGRAGWLVFWARRTPVSALTRGDAGMWARELYLCDPGTHPLTRTSEQRLRRRAAGRLAALQRSGDPLELDPLGATLELLHGPAA
jgi:hypothetical protein